MEINGIIWMQDIVDKLEWKHGVTTDEVEEVFYDQPQYRYIERGDIAGEDLYVSLGKTSQGRYLVVFFVHKKTNEALVISAREMTAREKRSYGR